MKITDKLKRLVSDKMVDCDAHDDCCTCPLSSHIMITMPLGDVESQRKNGAYSGNMPFGQVEIQVQPCMMFAEIIRQLNLNTEKEPGARPAG